MADNLDLSQYLDDTTNGDKFMLDDALVDNFDDGTVYDQDFEEQSEALDGSEEFYQVLTGGAAPSKVNEDLITEPAKKARSITKTNVVSIDPDITTSDMMTLIYSEIQKKRIAGHHIDSMNSFYRIGIKQIATKVFSVEGRLKNQRDKTEEDNEIAEISFKVEFTDINLRSPTSIRYKSGTTQMVTPNMARISGSTYSCPIYMDAKITATAFYKNGHTKTRTDELKEKRIGSVPCAIGTELCNTYNCSRETLKNIEEDPNFPGGCFIIKGYEWTIDNLENTTNNTFHVFRNAHLNEIARGNFLSKPGDAFENSYQIIIRYLVSGAITVEIAPAKHDKFEIPFYILFRAMGMTRDREIVNHIVYGVQNTDPVTRQMMDILAKSFEVGDAKFGPIRKTTNPIEIISFISEKIHENLNTKAAKKDDNIAKYLNTSFLNTIDRYLLPHIGTTPGHRIRKLRFLGHLINKLLSVYMGVIEPTDRDYYGNKRIHSAGTSVAKSFKTDFNFTVVQPIRNQLMKDFKNTPFSNVHLAESIGSAISSDELERTLTQSITSGNKTITVKRNEIANRVSSQTLYHKNDLNVKSTLTAVNTPNTSASKQNERADVMRRVHASYPGFICVTKSADSGESVGMKKEMACTASICGASSSFVLKNILLEDPDLIPLDDTTPEQISGEKLAKVFVNGDWIGCCRNYQELARKYRTKRRNDEINSLTTVDCKVLLRELYFWTDFGRMMRPLLIVYNNIEEYIARYRSGDKSVKFQQWIKLTKAHIRGLQTGKLTMEDLRVEGIIEYISPEEQENTFVSPNITVLRENVGNLRRMYTHCDIDQAIAGLVSLAAPMSNHSNVTRNTFYTNHRKQSAGWFALNYPFRIDKNTTFQHYCERPLISTFTDALTYPNGQNLIVALMLYTGRGQEDSIIANASSIDCGAFNASFYTYERAELEKNEHFGNPDYTRTMDIKKDASYENLNNGFIAEGTLVHKNDVLINKSAKLQKPINSYQYVDKSVIYKKDEPVIVEQVITPRNDDDSKIAKVKLRADRPLNVGDKLSSRTGNKGICAAKDARCDMPYCEDGLVPDIIVNCHSIPTRMAINQLMEMTLGKLAIQMGCHIDATPFRNNSITEVVSTLYTKYGVKYAGYRRMYDGRTGNWMDSLIFIGPTTYQRLQKFVVDEHYAMRTGPTSALTRQPLDGKNNDGGLRLGEMEKDCLAAQGVNRSLYEKLYDDSDGIDIYICRVCNNRAVVNEKQNIYKCKECGDLADIARIPSSWVANVLANESSAMNVKMQFELEPHQYPVFQ